jgi:hypothetical protein
MQKQRLTLAVLIATIAVVLSGCHPHSYRFQYPRDEQAPTNAFLATTPLPNPAAPEIGLFSVNSNTGLTRQGVVCFAPTDIRQASDPIGPKVWKWKFGGTVAYDVIATGVIDKEKFAAIQTDLNSHAAGKAITLVPCDILVNEVEMPGTLQGAHVFQTSYYRVSGDIIWTVRIVAPRTLQKQIEALMGSKTGLILPTKATLRGVEQPIAPPVTIQASVAERQK